jgi:GGDEF domain-containing protein
MKMMGRHSDGHVADSILKKNSPYLEGLLGLAAIVVVNLLWYRDDPGFIQVRPHPFWVVILLIAVRYGFKGALWTSILSSATLLAFHKISQPHMSFIDLIGAQRLTTPLLFIVVGIIMGEIREVQKRRFSELNVQFSDLKRDFENLSRRFSALDKVKQELDTRIISQEHTLTTLYRAAEGLKSLEEEKIYPAMLRLVRDFISAESCSIYLLDGNRLKRIAYLGSEGTHRGPAEAAPDEGIMGQALSRAETVSINTLIALDEFDAYARSNILVSSPMVNSKNQVLGLLNIEKLPFLKFNPQAVRLTALLADWGSAAVENARTFQETKDKNISDDITGAFTYEYFKKRLDEEFARARRYHLPLSILVIHVVDLQMFAEKVKKDLLMVLSPVFRNKLRKTDLLFHSGEPGTYNLLLTNTGLQGAKAVRKTMLDEINAFRFKPYPDSEALLQIRIGTVELEEDMQTGQEMLQEAYGSTDDNRTSRG